MKKLLLSFLSISLFLVPSITHATVASGWNTASLTDGFISPTNINGIKQGVSITASSTIGDGTQGGGLTINGGATSTGLSLVCNNGGIYNANCFAGSDIGAKINAAYAACPSTGCQIFVPAGTYNFSTQIFFNTASKPVLLSCPVGGGHFNNSGTVLHWTPATGTSTVFNTNNYVIAGMGIENCNFIGPAGAGGTGSIATSTFGITLGGTNGAFGAHLDNVHISGFGTGLYIWQNVSFLNVTNSVINKNAREIWSPQTTGANGENMRVTNSVIADANNNLFGASPANYCVDVQLSGNVQWQFTGNSFDDCQVYSEQFGGTANVWHFKSNHWENPGAVPVSIYTAYDYISTLSNVPATEIITEGNDFMTDGTGAGALSEFMGGGADFISIGDTVDLCTTCGVNISVPRFINNSNATAVDTISWTGLTNNGGSTLPAVTYVYGTHPYSPEGYGTGLGLSFNISQAVGGALGTTTITNLNGTLYAPNYSGSDIGAAINSAYASAGTGYQGGITIQLPPGKFSFSTKINCGNNGITCLIVGTPVGTELDWTGTGTSTEIDPGIQSTGIQHSSGGGMRNVRLVGSSTSTSSPSTQQIGIAVGGVNGSDGTILDGLTIEGFAQGLVTGKNVYHFMFSNSTVRNNAQDIYLTPANNSGEGMNFLNVFVIDAANHNPLNCFMMDDFSAAEVVFTGGSIDDCQVYVGKQNNATFIGVNWENPDSAYGQYTYLIGGDSQFTNINVIGGQIFNDQGAAPATWFNIAGGHIHFFGTTLFKQGGVIANLVTTAGGSIDWMGLNNTSGAVTNIYASVGFSANGTNGTYQISPLASAAGSFAAFDTKGNLIATTTPSVAGGNLSGVVNSLGLVTTFGTFTSSVLATAISDETGSGAAVFATGPFITSPIIVTDARIPIINGGAAAGSTLDLRSTSGAGTTDIIRFFTASQTLRMSILSNGNIGIGTSTPPVKFEVSNGASATSTWALGEMVPSGTSNSKSCQDMNTSTGRSASFYINDAGVMVTELGYCK